MSRSSKQTCVLATIDFALAFLIFLLCRDMVSGEFPRWFWLAATSLVWAGSGVAVRKFQFWRFRRPRYALVTIVVVDVVVYAVCFLLWKLLFPDRNILFAQVWPMPVLAAVECMMYMVYHRLFKRLPYLYVENLYAGLSKDGTIGSGLTGDGTAIAPASIEKGIEKAVRYADTLKGSPDLERIYHETKEMNIQEMNAWIRAHKSEFDPSTLIIENGDPTELDNLSKTISSQPTGKPDAVKPKSLFLLSSFNSVRHFNRFLEAADRCLPDGSLIVLHGETAAMRRQRIIAQFPAGIGQVTVALDYLWTRVLSKLYLTRDLYMWLTGRRHRNYPRVEVLGRIARAGFNINGEEFVSGSYFVSAVRKGEPQSTVRPYYGLCIRLPRLGKDGKRIGVFKMRTMYAYSEYIQDYVYRLNGLENGGKLKDDFRVNFLGRLCRSLFLDELPMFINLLKGDLKFVGVRPLSSHYLSLYTPEMQSLHLSVKPGIFPPLYYEHPKPVALEQIQASERRYIESYQEHPFRTDWTYFWGIVNNILFRRERSH